MTTAGWTLDQLKGSDTSGYTATYNRDYETMLFRDPENLPFYTVTGNGGAISQTVCRMHLT